MEEAEKTERKSIVTWNFSETVVTNVFLFFLVPSEMETGQRESWGEKKERRLMTVSNRTSGRNRSQTSLAGRAGASAAFVPTWTNRRPSELVHRCSLLLASESKEIHQYTYSRSTIVFYYYIIDEAHQIGSKTFQKVFKQKTMSNEERKFFGVIARSSASIGPMQSINHRHKKEKRTRGP